MNNIPHSGIHFAQYWTEKILFSAVVDPNSADFNGLGSHSWLLAVQPDSVRKQPHTRPAVREIAWLFALYPCGFFFLLCPLRPSFFVGAFFLRTPSLPPSSYLFPTILSCLGYSSSGGSEDSSHTCQNARLQQGRHLSLYLHNYQRYRGRLTPSH